MRICCWSVRRASRGSAAWELFREISPDLALLQEVTELPKTIADYYQVVMHRAAGRKWGTSLRFSTAILAQGTIASAIPLSSRWDWVNRDLEHFKGNLFAHQVSVRGREYRVLSAYSPAWPVASERLVGIDVEPVKLNPKVWVTELLWAALHEACDPNQRIPWIVGGDLNASETFDHMWAGGPRGNRKFLDRMNHLGLRECLRLSSGALVPTFRNPRDGRIVHQMDHLFVSGALAARLVSCSTAEHARVFEASLSVHLRIIADFSDSDDVAV